MADIYIVVGECHGKECGQPCWDRHWLVRAYLSENLAKRHAEDADAFAKAHPPRASGDTLLVTERNPFDESDESGSGQDYSVVEVPLST